MGSKNQKKSWTVTNWQREIVTGTGIYTKVWISYLSNNKMDTIDENKLNLGSHFSSNMCEQTKKYVQEWKYQ